MSINLIVHFTLLTEKAPRSYLFRCVLFGSSDMHVRRNGFSFESTHFMRPDKEQLLPPHFRSI